MANEVHTLTKKGRIKRPAYNLVAQWVLDAWNSIDPNLIRKSFKCCGISNSRDGKEDHLIFDYDQLGQQTNSRNHIYIQEETNTGNIGGNSNIGESSNSNLDERLNGEILNANIGKSLNLKVKQVF